MRLLKLAVTGDSLFKNSSMTMDFFAADRVVAQDDAPVEVTRVGDFGHIYSLNVIGIGGVNASGKTTVLKLLILALSILQGNYIARGIWPELSFIPAKLNSPFKIEAIFWHDGKLYCLKSELETVRLSDSSSLAVRFIRESLWRFTGSNLTKKTLTSFSSFYEACELECSRNEEKPLPEGVVKALGDGVSIARVITGNSTTPYVPQRKLGEGTLPTAVVRLFDPSVEYLIWDEQADVYRLKFFDEPERAVSRSAAASMLSTGTVSGTELVMNAVEALAEGGYLLVDEIENSINKTLVVSIINLFSSPATNPKGALLVFTTHYPELLDELERKDNLYLVVRGEDHETQLVKYSNHVKRIENKKSEVVLSNFIKGTNPSYPLVQDMRAYVKERVNE